MLSFRWVVCVNCSVRVLCGPRCGFHSFQARLAPSFSRDCIILTASGLAPEFACGVALAPFTKVAFSAFGKRTPLIPAPRALSPSDYAHMPAALPSLPQLVSLGSAVGPVLGLALQECMLDRVCCTGHCGMGVGRRVWEAQW